jgi:hypothetical protein
VPLYIHENKGNDLNETYMKLTYIKHEGDVEPVYVHRLHYGLVLNTTAGINKLHHTEQTYIFITVPQNGEQCHDINTNDLPISCHEQLLISHTQVQAHTYTMKQKKPFKHLCCNMQYKASFKIYKKRNILSCNIHSVCCRCLNNNAH